MWTCMLLKREGREGGGITILVEPNTVFAFDDKNEALAQ